MTNPVITEARFHEFCRSKDFTPEYLKSSPMLRRSLVTGIRIALCEPVEPREVEINGTLTGVLQGALDAIRFFSAEVDELAAISHVANLLGHTEIVNEKSRFKGAYEYFGASLQRRSHSLGEFFAHRLFDVSLSQGDGAMLRLVLGIREPALCLFVKKVVLPALQDRGDATRLVELVGDNYEFGSFCIHNSLTAMVRHIKSQSQKGKLLEIDLGM